MQQENKELEKITSLAKRRGFIFPSGELYGGLNGFWDYGPLGTEMRRNIKHLWWNKFVRGRAEIVGLDAAIITNSTVWQSSGHVEHFNDPLIECKSCHQRFKADQFAKDLANQACPHCGTKGQFTEIKQFNTMFKTTVGPLEDEGSMAYLRPETAQGMFVNFKNIQESSRLKLPFGIAQIGKAFRNEITTGNFIFRIREFEQMEIEYFIRESGWEEVFEAWRKLMWEWIKEVGITEDMVHELNVPDGERAHYSKKTIDFEFDFPFGRKELYGLANRTDFDLKNHFPNAPYKDQETGEELWPHVIEPTWGVERTMLAILCSAYSEEPDNEGTRVVLKLLPKIAPVKVAIFPLQKDEKLTSLAREIYQDLMTRWSVQYDQAGSVGRRYRRQDEIGTPYCLTVDFESLADNKVTVRDRDSMTQTRVLISSLKEYLADKLDF